jgi:hypothetical protein
MDVTQSAPSQKNMKKKDILPDLWTIVISDV